MGLDALLWWPVIKGLVIMHLWCEKETVISSHYWPDIEQEVEHDNRCINVHFGGGSFNDVIIIWILSHIPLISKNVYCCYDLDRGPTGLVDVCYVVVKKDVSTFCGAFKRSKCENFL